MTIASHSDQDARNAFCYNIDENYSVIAPAGVGKTYAIVERIQQIVRKKPHSLPALHVITYTKKAAEALSNRTLARVQDASASTRQLLNQSFFGTIHSLCYHYIQQFQTYTLLPQRWAIHDQDEAIRADFLSELNPPMDENTLHILRHVELEQIVNLAAELRDLTTVPKNAPSLAYPHIAVDEILDYKADARNTKSVLEYQSIARQWAQEADNSENFLPIPSCNKGGEEFKALFHQAFQPLEKWLSVHAFYLVQQLAQQYFHFRVRKGYLIHEDLIRLFQELLTREEVIQYFKQRTISVILDEAQDTDAEQFQLLLKWISLNPANQFSMMGDPQQAIYTRANIQQYLSTHSTLTRDGFCQKLVFTNTFRCPPGIVSYLNETFPSILNSRKDPSQVDYVRLTSAATDRSGCCHTLTLPAPNSEDPLEEECLFLSNYLKNFIQTRKVTPSDICILCPRNDWLREISRVFTQQSLPLQIYSSKQTWRDQDWYAWLCACVHIIAYPEDAFEIVGFLRGCLQIPERQITRFVKEGNEVQILQPSSSNDPVADALNQLYELRRTLITRNLYQVACELVDDVFRKTIPSTIPNQQLDYIALSFKQMAQECVQHQGNWFELARQLKEKLNAPFDYPQELDPTCLQGYSCHKAKGLEWPVVIVPFLYRPLYPKPPHYPYLTEKAIVWTSDSNGTQASESNRKRELARLFYVSCTRAKQELILVNDQKFWGPSHNLTLHP